MEELSGVWVCKEVTYRVHIKLAVVSLLLFGCCVNYFSRGCDKVPGKWHLRKLEYGLKKYLPVCRESMAAG